MKACLLEPGHGGVGGVEGEHSAGSQHAVGLGQHTLGLAPRHVLDALPAVDHVERARGVAAEVGHGVVAVGDPPAPGLHRRRLLVRLVELVAILAGEVHDHDLLKGVRVAHEHERPVGHPHGDTADVEDAPGPWQAPDEHAAPVVQGRPELGHGRGMAPLGRVDQPFDGLAGAHGALLELGGQRVVVRAAGVRRGGGTAPGGAGGREGPRSAPNRAHRPTRASADTNPGTFRGSGAGVGDRDEVMGQRRRERLVG